MAVLQILAPEGSRVMELPDGQVSIGRSSENDILIEDARGSREHCVLIPASGGYTLKDLGSRNGTKVNGKLIGEVLLNYGDAFCIGKTVLRLFEKNVPPLELVDLSETHVDAEPVEAPTAIIVEAEEEPEPPPAQAGPPTAEQIVAEARRDLNALRTAGNDPGFSLDKITFLDVHGKTIHDSTKIEASSEAVRTLRMLMYGAFRTRATDMHLNANRDSYQARFRVDGKMLPMVVLPTPVVRAIISSVKVLSELDIARRDVMQEGSFSICVPRQVDCRVSISPTVHGENLVVRILDTAVVPSVLDELSLSAVMLRQMRSACQVDSGMIIVSGPTGSGKTTTLYTALRSIDSRSRNVITIEDPIEYHLDGITQIETDEKRGLTFGQILRSVLRQDPDVILVGEIRDQETARTAMQAAMTGHLVFSTLHARDSISSIFRLLDLGVEPYMIANSVSIFLAQRLVRKLCEHCKKSFKPKPSQLVRMKMQNRSVTKLYTHVGCRRCMEVGFWGRRAIFEMLSFNDNLRDALMTTKTIHDIRMAAGEWTYQTLLESGYRLVVDGITTIEEVETVAARE